MTGPEHSRAKRRCQASTEIPTNGQKVDNSGSTLQKLFQLYRQADLCDVQLQVGAHLFHAHKLILSMTSDVFKTMLTDAKWPDARKARIVLSEEHECIKVFGEFLQYMYTGSIHLSNWSVLPVLTLADKYNIRDLGNVCRQYMLSHCHAALSHLKVISWLQYARLCNDHDLEVAFRSYVELNFNHVMQSEDFLTMRADTLDEVLHFQHLVVHSEHSLFTGLKRWLLHNTGSWADNSRRSAAAQKTFHLVMSHIHFPLIKQAQLLVLQSDPFVQTHASFFAPKLHAAWAVHIFPQCRDHSGTVNELCDPRKDHIGTVDVLSDQRKDPSGTVDVLSDPRKDPSGTVDVMSDAHRDHRLSSSVFSKPQANINSKTSPGSRTVFRSNSDSSIIFSSRNSESGSSGQTSPAGHLSTRTGFSDAAASVCFEKEKFSFCQQHLAVNTPAHFNSRGQVPHPPRNYTCDDWSTCLTIGQFAEFPRYASHTYFFSTPASTLPTPLSSQDRCQAGSRCVADRCQAASRCVAARCQAASRCITDRCQAASRCVADRCQAASQCVADRSQAASHCAADRCQAASRCVAEGEDVDDSAMLEWQAELYPKGVRFPPAKMIGIPNNYDIDEHCREVVRLAVSCKTPAHSQPCRVDISVLAVATGTEDGLEYMEALAHKSCIFDRDHTMHNIDHIVPFAQLNRPASKYLTQSVAMPGSGRTCFKVMVIIKPTH